MTTKELDLTTAPISRCLVSLILPIMTANLLRTAFHFINGIWVGGLGPQALAAVSASGFLLWLTHSITNIISAGATPLVAQSVGAKKSGEAAHYSQQAILSSMLLSCVLFICIFSFSGSILKAMGLHDEIIHLGRLYINTLALFLPLMCLLEIFASILVGYGDTKTPNIIFTIGFVINMVLDPLLIYGLGPFPKLGVTGASWATNITVIIEFLVFLYLILENKLHIKFPKKFRFDLPAIKDMLKIGVPLSISSIIFSSVYMILTKIIAHFGTSSVASLGIGHRVESLSFIIFMAFSSATTALVGQNIGAEKMKRAEEAAFTAIKFVCFIGLVNTVLFLLFPQQLAMIFTKDHEVVKIASAYVTIVAFSQIFMGITMVLDGAFAGAGNTVPPMVISIITTFGRLPLAYLLALTLGWGINGVWWTITLLTIIRNIFLIYWFSRGDWKKIRIMKKDE